MYMLYLNCLMSLMQHIFVVNRKDPNGQPQISQRSSMTDIYGTDPTGQPIKRLQRGQSKSG